MSFSLCCTWQRAARICSARSPLVEKAQNVGAKAIAAGWRVWLGRDGLGDDRLLSGEALCPAHRHDPAIRREAQQTALSLNELRSLGFLNTAGEGDK